MGPTLAELIHISRKTNCFTMWTALTIGIELIKLIRFIHDRKYIHRDIKPDNFVVGQDEYSDCIYVIDFGLAKRYVNE